MDENTQAKFAEKIKELLNMAKKKKNVLEYQEISDFFADMPLEEEQMEKVLEYLDQNNVDVLRITDDDDVDDEEIILTDEDEVDVENIDLNQRELKVTGKRNKQRIVPFSAELANAFKAYLPVRQAYVNTDAGALFFNRRKLRIDRRRVGLIVKHYLSLVTTQRKKSPHVLRHTFASAMLNNGADLEAIKELLGHESVATTEVYTHTTFADLKKQYKLAHPRA